MDYEDLVLWRKIVARSKLIEVEKEAVSLNLFVTARVTQR